MGASSDPAAPPLPTITSKRIQADSAAGMTFVDGGRYLLLNQHAGLLLVDAARGEKVGEAVELDSVLVPSPYPPPHDYGIQLHFRDAVWRWDDDAKSIVGVGWTGFGERHGPAIWRPGESSPVALTGIPESVCGPGVFSSDGALLAVRTSSEPSCGPYQHGWRLIDFRSGKPIGSPIETGLTSQFAFHRDGTLAAISDSKGVVRLVDTKTGKVTQLPGAPPSGVGSMAFHPTHHVLLVSHDDEILAWDLRAEPYQRSRLAVPEISADEWRRLSFSPDGKYLAIGTNSEATLRDVSDYRVVHRERAWTPHFAFNPDGTRLAISSGGELILLELGDALPAPPVAAKPDWFSKLKRLPEPPALEQPELTYDATITGRVTANGQPVVGASVELGPSSLEWPNARALKPRFTRSDTDGRYRFDQAPRVDSYLSIEADAFQLAGASPDLRKSPRQTFNHVLEPAVVIKGKVLDPQGRPAAGVEVIADRGQLKTVVKTDQAGAFVIDHHGENAYYLSNHLIARRKDGAVAMMRFARGGSMLAQAPAQGYAFVVANGATNEVVLRLRAVDDPKVLRITVTDEAGKPAAGATVNVNNTFRGETDAEGVLTVEIHDKQVYLEARKAGVVGRVNVALPHRGPVTVALKRR
ncbi:MAG: hypothetical protein R3B48_07980 [Kofleriaceae bacterium]